MFSERVHGQRGFLMFLWRVSSTFDTCLSGGASWTVERKGANLSLGTRQNKKSLEKSSVPSAITAAVSGRGRLRVLSLLSSLAWSNSWSCSRAFRASPCAGPQEHHPWYLRDVLGWLNHLRHCRGRSLGPIHSIWQFLGPLSSHVIFVVWSQGSPFPVHILEKCRLMLTVFSLARDKSTVSSSNSF